MSYLPQNKVEVAIRLVEDSDGHVERHVAVRADAYLDAKQTRELALQLLDMVDLISPSGDSDSPPGVMGP